MIKSGCILQVPFYKKLISYFYPVTLRRSAGDKNVYLELLLYRNRYQLVTADALYSDGDKYMPAITAINHLEAFLPSVKSVLILGTGLGSMIRVIHAKGYHPRYTLVEYDKIVLGWALELMDETHVGNITPVCSDAKEFMEREQSQFDLVFVDIFNSRVVPDFATASPFLQQCRNRLTQNGRLVLNYIVNQKEEWDRVQHDFAAVFPHYDIKSMGINKILITNSRG